MDRFEQRKLTRARLIDSAMKLFSERGYDHATIDDIAQEVGYSKGAYYFHFSTKEDILLELLRRWSEDRTRMLAAAGAGQPGTDARALVEALVSYDEERRWPGVVLEFWAQSMRNEDVKKRLTQAYAAWRAQLAEALAAAGTAASAEEAAGVALAAHDGYVVQLAIGPHSGGLMSATDLADALVTPLEGERAGERGRRAAAV